MIKQIYIVLFLLVLSLGCSSKSTEKLSQVSTDKTEKLPDLPEKVSEIDIVESKIKWTGKKVTKSHSGTIDIKSGVINTKGFHVTSGSVEIDMNSIKNTSIKKKKSRENLTRHLKNEDFFNVDSFPTSTITINSSNKINNGRYKYFGDLTIKGITNPVNFEGSISQSEDKFSSKITMKFDRTRWGIKYGSGRFFEDLGDRMILDDIELEISLITK
ncbi:MAG: lipid-binding protein [Candidatus Marinimicrobia bacterium]|nr:lipid-binding protein [Candidatus Neomarinimicrobiota bacterium]|tara:strand:+ start:4617 stop:5261 length:645 start_codon:yes stop_codon:yes gene_type:complete